MTIWLSMLIPVLTAVILFVCFRRRTLWWEFAIPFVASFVLILIFKAGVESAQTRDVEFWGGALQMARYDEQWDEEVPCRHPIPCSHPKYCKDSQGKRYQCGTKHANDGYRHPYDVDVHPPSWRAVDTNGIWLDIDRGRFESLASEFGGTRFVDMRRDYHSIDGDRYEADWPGTDETLHSVTTRHAYENRVAVSNSVFNYQEVADPSGLFSYPKIQAPYHMPAILGDGGLKRAEAERILQIANARLNFPQRQLQVRLFVLLFGADSTLATGLDQEALWKGGNKNELVVAIGLSGTGVPQWAHVFSWTKVERLKIDVREAAFETQDLEAFATRLVELVNESWIRREFAEFDYLTVSPPLWAVLLTFFLTGLINGLLSWWIVANEHSESPIGQRQWGRPHRVRF